MKRKLVMLLIVIGMMFCSACENNQQEKDMVKYESGIFYDKNWDETVGTYSDVAVPNKETAIKIAQAIFDGMEKSNEEQKYILQSVFYDKQDEIWIVSFGDNSSQIILGGDCSIAIQRKDGKVLRIWFGE